jgi:hypothetical protein
VQASTPEYKAIVNEIDVLAMEYHQLIDLGQLTRTGLLYARKITLYVDNHNIYTAGIELRRGERVAE